MGFDFWEVSRSAWMGVEAANLGPATAEAVGALGSLFRMTGGTPAVLRRVIAEKAIIANRSRIKAGAFKWSHGRGMAGSLWLRGKTGKAP
jgi:hypothetical protein